MTLRGPYECPLKDINEDLDLFRFRLVTQVQFNGSQAH